MIERKLTKTLLERLDSNASVALLGPRQVGKTTLAFSLQESRPVVYLDLENPVDLQKVQDIAAFHRANRERLIILDEVQRLPDVFTTIRGLIDTERRKGNRTGHFLFLGSASMELLRQSGESLAGRISYLELFPVNVHEYMESACEITRLNELWLRGGFPDSLLADNDGASIQWRRDFIRTYLERDIPQFGPRIPATTMQRLWMMLAHAQGSSLNASKLATAIEVSNVSVGRYIDLLADLLLIRKLQPYARNIKKRLVKSPRVYVRDSGLVHALLNIPTFNDLLGHPVTGNSWEGFVIENILSALPPGVTASYYRSSGGAEIDLILEFQGSPQQTWAIEIKRSPSAGLARGFHEACEDIQPTQKFMVHGQEDRFTMKAGVEAVGLFEFIELLAGEN